MPKQSCVRSVFEGLCRRRRFRVIMAGDQPWQEVIVSQVCQKLFSACRTLDQAFKIFDANKDGLVEYNVSVCLPLCLGFRGLLMAQRFGMTSIASVH